MAVTVRTLENFIGGQWVASTGESVRAVVIPAKGAALDVASLLAHGTQNLARYKVPASIELRSDLPKTAVGKIARRQIALN